VESSGGRLGTGRTGRPGGRSRRGGGQKSADASTEAKPAQRSKAEPKAEQAPPKAAESNSPPPKARESREGQRNKDGGRGKMQVKKGDQVLFTSYAGTEVKLGEKEYMIMDESDIMAIIEG